MEQRTLMRPNKKNTKKKLSLAYSESTKFMTELGIVSALHDH
jgi:hypothetical protein